MQTYKVTSAHFGDGERTLVARSMEDAAAKAIQEYEDDVSPDDHYKFAFTKDSAVVVVEDKAGHKTKFTVQGSWEINYTAYELEEG